MSVKNIFGTAGIRGVYGKDLTFDIIFKLGLALGKFSKGNKVLLGWDCRKSSVAISNILVSSLLSNGNDVNLAGLITTPALQKFIRDLREYGLGIMVTASHNPPKYNGIKVIKGDGTEISYKEEIEISKLFWNIDEIEIDWKRMSNSVTDIHEKVVSHYIDSLSAYMNRELLNRKFVIGLDYANCSSVVTIGRFLSLFRNIKMYELNYIINGFFPGRLPEPIPEHLKRTVDFFRSNNIDLGVAFDGDGDRGIVIDKYGKIYWGDEIGTLIAYYIGDELGINSVVTPVSSSIIVEKVLEPIGIKVYRTKVGAKNIVLKMIEKGSKLGFEENGGILFSPHLYARDGGITLLMSMRLLTEMNRELRSLRSKFPVYYQIKTKVTVEELEKNERITIIEEIKDKYSHIAYKIEELDGAKIFIDDDTWVLIRPSGTEPLIRIFTESPDPKRSKKLSETFKSEVIKLYKKIISSKGV